MFISCVTHNDVDYYSNVDGSLLATFTGLGVVAAGAVVTISPVFFGDPVEYGVTAFVGSTVVSIGSVFLFGGLFWLATTLARGELVYIE